MTLMIDESPDTTQCKTCRRTFDFASIHGARQNFVCNECKKPRNPGMPGTMHGLSKEEYQALLYRQDGCCAICKKFPDGKKLAVDHCHDTGQIRGLLCFSCNTALGKFKDNILMLQAAINYLQQPAPTLKKHKAFTKKKSCQPS